VGDHLSILVVDDEPANIEMITEVLKASGYVVASATDGFKAIAACKVRMPDLILLDLQMPLMSGLDVFKRLRGDEKTRDIPVVFLRRKGEKPSGLAGAEDEHWVLSKPIAREELLSRVRTALRENTLKKEIRKREVQLRELSLSDPLTSFRSVRYLAEFLRAEINQCRRYKVPLSLVLLEVDDYKTLLKTYGQSGANNLITQLSSMIGVQNRDSDIIVRLSESELGLFLSHTELAGAVDLAERLRESVSAAQFVSIDRTFTATVSVGVSQLSEAMDEDGKMLIAYARSAVTEAKKAGGNMTLIAE
jgi:two-component system, cell cycle response regulator